MAPAAAPTSAPMAAGAPAPNGNAASSAAHSIIDATKASTEGLRFDTLAIHKGSEPEPTTGAIIPSICLATAFRQSTAGISGADGFDYTRFGNPNRNALEANLAALEGGKHAFAFSSGTAVTTAILSTIPNGSHVVSVADVYGGTHKILTQIVNETNAIKTTFVDLDSNGLKERLTEAITPETRLIWLETPTNPTLRLADLPLVSQIAKAINPDIKIAVDGTFMTPYYQNPLSLGADVVSHSATKYLNGHTDVLLGLAVTNDEGIAKKLKFVQSSLGAVPSPFDCWLVLRGLKTLPVRMREHGRNALRLAKYLDKHPSIKEVIYPGLPSHGSFNLAKKQIATRALQAQINDGVDIEKGLQYSGMLSFRIDCDPEDPTRGSDFLKELKIITLALSLGGVENWFPSLLAIGRQRRMEGSLAQVQGTITHHLSFFTNSRPGLIEQPSTMTHWMVPLQERIALGIGHDLIRLSVGLEDPHDLEEDLNQALTKVIGKPAAVEAADEANKKRKVVV